MPKKPYLNDMEMDVIIKLSSEGKNPYQISKFIQRSPNVVYKYLSSPSNYGKGILRSGRKSLLSEKEKRKITREVGHHRMSLRQAARATEAGVSYGTIHRCIQSSNLKYEKMLSAPTLTKSHKKNRLIFARDVILQGNQFWNKILFSDEKRFCLDGPDNCSYYWHDVRSLKKVRPKNPFPKGIMVWAIISRNGFRKLCFVEGNINSNKYQEVLGDNLLPYYVDQEMIFQQDNASSHISKSTKDWLQTNNISCLGWPAKSPDLNIIENVWGFMTNLIYNDQSNFQSISDLKEKILFIWDNIPQSYINNLYDSFPERLLNVISRNGSFLTK